MATDADIRSSLTTGEIEIHGRLTASSNGALLVTTSLNGVQTDAVYKPVAHERPLWDFPENTLAKREVAARILDQQLWNLVPETVWRTAGPLGPGMCQQWIDAQAVEFVKIFPADAVDDGWLPVLQAQDSDGNPVVIAHPDSDELRKVVLFDELANNADRKAGHLLRDSAEVGVLSVDHGLTFNVEPKLRTVLWGFAGQSVAPQLLDQIRRVAADEALLDQLRQLLNAREVELFVQRAESLIATPFFPLPPADRNPIPWPLA